jgi:hypothetical protein
MRKVPNHPTDDDDVGFVRGGGGGDANARGARGASTRLCLLSAHQVGDTSGEGGGGGEGSHDMMMVVGREGGRGAMRLLSWRKRNEGFWGCFVVTRACVSQGV